jgi:tetratricopeptide (TPR) repeat protein
MKSTTAKLSLILFLTVVSVRSARGETTATLKAREALKNECWSEAFEAANRALALDSRDGEAYSIRGKVYFKYEQFDHAHADFDRALQVKPDLVDSGLYQYRAECFMEKQAYQQAVLDLQHAIRLYPTFFAYSLLGRVYYKQNKLEESIQCFTKSIALNKKSFWTYKDRADSYVRLRQYAKALSDYAKFIELNPTAPVGYNARAQLYLKMGKKELADEDLKRAQKLEKVFE